MMHRSFEHTSRKMREAFGTRVVTVSRQIAGDPQPSRTILEYRVDVETTQACRVVGFGTELANPVAVVALQAVSRAEPDESGSILNDLRHAGVGGYILERDAFKQHVPSLLDGETDAQISGSESRGEQHRDYAESGGGY